MTAVDSVDLDVEKGEFVVILGHSGSGKTTLLSLIGGLTIPDDGTVEIDSVDNWQQSDGQLAVMRNKKIGFIFQFASLIPTLTVLENILLPLSFTSDPQGDRQYALDLLEQVGLAGRQDDLPGQLSGGQQQRLCIARTIAVQPEVILMDEPCSALDPIATAKIEELIDELREDFTVVIVTHDYNVARHGTRIVHLKDGLIVEDAQNGHGHGRGTAEAIATERGVDA